MDCLCASSASLDMQNWARQTRYEWVANQKAEQTDPWGWDSTLDSAFASGYAQPAVQERHSWGIAWLKNWEVIINQKEIQQVMGRLWCAYPLSRVWVLLQLNLVQENTSRYAICGEAPRVSAASHPPEYEQLTRTTQLAMRLLWRNLSELLRPRCCLVHECQTQDQD